MTELKYIDGIPKTTLQWGSIFSKLLFLEQFSFTIFPLKAALQKMVPDRQ